MIKTLRCDEIEATSATQGRARIDPMVMEDYARDMKNGAIFPPCVVFAESGSERYIMADGFHRIAACGYAGIETIECEVREGGLGDALDHCYSANAQNGMRRTNADKIHVVRLVLKDPRHATKSLREIAELCRVSHKLVRQLKLEINEQKEAQKAKKDEKVSTVDSNKRPSKPPPTQAEVDRMDFMAAISVVRSFPFAGAQAPESMELTENDYKAINAAAEWLGDLCNEMEKSKL